MAQTFKTPKFYIDYLQYAKASGLFKNYHSTGAIEERSGGNVIGINPTSGITYKGKISDAYDNIFWATEWQDFPSLHEMEFVGVLGHNLATAIATDSDSNIQIKGAYGKPSDVQYMEFASDCGIVNAEQVSTAAWKPTYDGFSLVKCSMDDVSMKGDGRLYPALVNYYNGAESHIYQFGCYLLGKTYTMPYAPDLNMKISIEHGGYKSIETKSGNTLTNANYTQQPLWMGGLGAWELATAGEYVNRRNKLRRSGRKVFTLSFSFLKDTDVYPDIMQTGWYNSINTSSTPYTSTTSVNNTLLDSNTFISQVLAPTHGGQLPFIMQMDSSNNSPDQFSIVKIVKNSIDLQETSPNLISISMKLKEVW